MKHTIINRIAALLLLAAGLAGCSKEEALPDTPYNHGARLTISVTDGGYASADGARTRAVENGYATTFTAGDQIGLYVVKPDGTYAVEKVCLTLNDVGGGTLAWQAPSGTDLYYEGINANLKYFAYYPYQTPVNGILDPAATTAAGFFADVVSQWTPATDQSTHALYTAQDLMIGSGSIGSKQGGTFSLSFTMTHAMALVVIETPTTKYILTDKDNNPLPDYYILAPNTKFNGFTPYSPSIGTYRYLVKPTQSVANNLIGSYTGANGNTKEYAVSPNGITAANYACYKVDGGITPKTHTLQVGDFYMKDGSLVSKDEVTLTAAQKAACIGVVYSTDPDRIGGAAKTALAEKGVLTPHGLVMALTNAAEGCRWGDEKRDESIDESGGDNNPFQNHTCTFKERYENVNGYAETQWMVGKIKNGGYNADTYKAFDIASKYGTAESGTDKYAAPSNSTGWFLPSMGQWWDIVENLGEIDLSIYKSSTVDTYLFISGVAQTAATNLNKYLQRIDGATTFSINTGFWVGSEYSIDNACSVTFDDKDALRLGYNEKNNSNRVRCAFAF